VTVSPVDWAFAERVALRLVRTDQDLDGDVVRRLHDDMAELTAEAERLVAAATGLHSSDGPARARVIDRPGWVRVNVAAFQRLLRPLVDRLGEQLAQRSPAGRVPTGLAAAPLTVTQKLAGLEVGALLGWMSGRVLGQYDLLVVDDDSRHEQDWVYYVGPNLLALERRFGFDERQFRLWIALHECAHRAQFTGVPWLRAHYLSLVDRMLGSVDPDPKRLLDALREVRQAPKRLEDGGLAAVFATPEQRQLLDSIGGLMALLEGHGDVTMDRAAGPDRLPQAERFARILRERRRNQSGPARLLQRLVGLEAKLAQYEQGERFIAAVEAAGGPALLDQAWVGPEHLPTLAEIREPERWLRRVEPLAAAG
jgi:coenzyme F420 biosynthesis associated uncharacterized protein